MTDSSDSPKLNGSSGFISYEENSSFEQSCTETSHETIEYSRQNKRNHRLATLRRRQNGQGDLPKNNSDGAVNQRRQLATRQSLQEEFTPERLAEAERSVNFYRQFGDFWNTFPKTDYTYSRSSQWYGSEVAPGVRRIPNMSRRTYRTLNSSSAASPLPTPPSSQSSGFSTFRTRHLFHSTGLHIEEESWFTYIKRVVSTTVTTVVSRVYKSVFRSEQSSLSGVEALGGSDEEAPAWLSKWFLWPLILFLLGLIYYSVFGSDPPMQVDINPVLTGASSALSDGAAAVCRPFWYTWEFSVYFVTLFFNSIVMFPSLFVPVNETSTVSAEFSQSQMAWLMDTIRDFVESMDPHDFRLSPEEEDHLVDRVSEKVTKRMQELQDELDAIKGDQKATKEQNEEVGRRMRELQEELDGMRSERAATEEGNEEVTKLMKEMQAEWEKTQQQEREHRKALLATLVAMQEKMKKIEEASRSDVVTPVRSINVPNDFKESVMAIVEELLEKYHADRTGKTDYALLSNGGAIASIRCTRPYKERSGEYVLWQVFNWEFINSPDIILKPGIMPGECWAFEGANGYLAIKLSLPIFVHGFTMEHTPRELSPYGHIKSAPRKFSVWGLESLEDREETFLGRFEFFENGKSLQSYDSVIADRPFHLVELRIESNHGHLEYTCLYRFRVHGRPAT